MVEGLHVYRDVLEHVEAVTFVELDAQGQLSQTNSRGAQKMPEPFPFPRLDGSDDVVRLRAGASLLVC